MSKLIRNVFSFLLSVPILFYRYFLSPLKRPSCRHIPSCSEYVNEALRLYGPIKGLILGTNRILRCRPGGTQGYDPVPLIWIKRYKPLTSWFGHWQKCNRLKR